MADPGLKKEVQRLVSQGYTEAQIKHAMTQKGYSIADIGASMGGADKAKKTKSHPLKLFGVIALLIAVATIISILLFAGEKYSDDPKDWISEKGNVKEINVEEATKGAGYLDEVGLQYEDGEISTVFGYDGIYNGKIFYGNTVAVNDSIKMRITKDINPSNNIPEGFIIEKINSDKVIAHIFLDEDWRRIIGDKTNIIWGADYQNIKRFEFFEIKEGVYYDSIEDDQLRFNNNFKESFGGIIVGKVTKNEIENSDLSQATFFRIS